MFMIFESNFCRHFFDLWETRFNCKLRGIKTSSSNKFKRYCHGNESLPKIERQYTPVRTVINAVYAFAHALDSLQKELCGRRVGICPEMAKFKRTRLLEHLKNVSFWDPSVNTTIKFDENYEVREHDSILIEQGYLVSTRDI